MSRIRTIKRAIPNESRRALARRAGCEPGSAVDAPCHYCGRPGRVCWTWKRLDGTPGQWVTFQGLEIDHVVPEFHGGTSDPENLVLACRPCNRRKGHKL